MNIKEYELRLYIYRVKMTATQKLVLLAILQKCDWSTYAGDISISDISNIINHNRRSVSRAIVWLRENNYIIRTSKKKAADQDTKGDTRINVEKVLSESSASDKMTYPTRDKMTSDKSASDKMTSDKMVHQLGTKEHIASDKMTYNYNYNYNSINSNSITASDKMTSDKMTYPDVKPDLRLEDHQSKKIDLQLKRLNLADTFQNRKQLARRLFNIKLLKGGYYETL